MPDIQPDPAIRSAFAGLKIRQVCQTALPGLPAQTEVDLASNGAHARTVVAEDVNLPAAGLKSVAPFGLALYLVLVGLYLDLDEEGFPIDIECHEIRPEQAAIGQVNFGRESIDLVLCFAQHIGGL